MKRASISILAAALVGCAAASIHAASLAIDSLAGAITQNEIDSFKAYMAAQVPPPTPWGALNATTHNAWCDGAGGNNLEAMGLMYEATGDINILTNMIYWADTCVSERNDLMAATNGGQRICWDGVIDKIWVAQDLATTNPSTGCETGDAQGHMAYAALLILQNPSLWNQTVPDGDPYGYGTTYFQRATNYVQKCDEANNQYCLKYFVQPGTYLIVDPTNSAWKGLDTPNNRQSMWYVGFGRLAQCHEILGDNPSLATEYENIGKAASGQCINGMAGYHPTTVNGDAVYDWGYYPFDVYPNHLENVGHGAYDMYGVWRAYDRSVYGYTLSTVKPFANALVDVMNIATNSFSGAVNGTGTAQNYMQQQWLWLADLRSSVYDAVAEADLVSGRYKSNPYMDAAILWMKNRRQQEFAVTATPSSQTITAGNGTSYTTTVSPWGGFAGTVSLSVSGLPSGASASFNDSSIALATINAASTNVTLSVSTSSSTAGGTYTLTITGTSGSVSHSTTVSLAVNGCPPTPITPYLMVNNGSWQQTDQVTIVSGDSVTFGPQPLSGGSWSWSGPNGFTSTSRQITVSNITSGGNYVATYFNSCGTASSDTFVVTVAAPPPDFSLSASPGSLTIVQGNNGTSTITVNPVNGYSGTVSLSASGLPSGVTASFNPSSTTSSSTLTLSASSTAATGTATVTITGTDGTLTHTTTISLTVNPAPDFSITATPSSQTVTAGNGASYTTTIGALNGFSGAVSLSVSGLPSNASASFNPASVTGSGNSTLTVNTTTSTPSGTYTLTITGTSGSLTHSTTVSLTVNPAPDFSLSASPTSLTITQGNNGTSTITVNPINGYSGTVSLSASGLPSGVTASFNPPSTTSTSTLTLTASSTAATGTATVTITGTDGTLTHAVTISLTINPASGLPAGWTDADIGSVGLAGSASYSGGTFTVNGSGGDIWGTADAFNYAWQSVSGDQTVIARVASQQNTSSWAKSGVMFRESTAANASYVGLYLTPGNGVSMQYRNGTGTSAVDLGRQTGLTAPYWVKIVRSGNTFTGYSSPDGSTWTQVGSISVTMASGVDAGLAVCAHNNTALNTSTFDNVSIAGPAPDFSLSASPTSLTIVQGNNGTSTITINPVNGYNNTVSLSASGLPSGVTASFNPSSTTSSSTLTLSASSTAATGTATVTVTGTDGTLTHTTTISLTVNAAVNFSGIYQIQNEASGLVLNNQGKLTNGSPITQWTSVTSSNLDWQFFPTSNGYYQINSCKSALDAVVQSASTAAGAGIIQWSFGSSGDDQWQPQQNGDGSYTFVNLHSGLVLGDPGSSTSTSTQMDQETATGGSNQKWVLLKQ